MLEVKKVVVWSKLCGMMYTEDTCGELWSRLVSDDDDDAACTVHYAHCIIAHLSTELYSIQQIF